MTLIAAAETANEPTRIRKHGHSGVRTAGASAAVRQTQPIRLEPKATFHLVRVRTKRSVLRATRMRAVVAAKSVALALPVYHGGGKALTGDRGEGIVHAIGAGGDRMRAPFES